MTGRPGRDRRVAAGPSHPDQALRGDDGMVTAELAVALPSLVIVLAGCLVAVAAVLAQLRCVDAAGLAARSAARGEPPGQTRQVALEQAPPGATLSITTESVTTGAADSVAVVVDDLRPPLLGRFLPVLTIRATAATPVEPGVGATSPAAGR